MVGIYKLIMIPRKWGLPGGDILMGGDGSPFISLTAAGGQGARDKKKPSYSKSVLE